MELIKKLPGKGILTVVLCVLLFFFSCSFVGLLMARVGNAAIVIRHTDITAAIGDTEFSYYILHQLMGLEFHGREIEFSDVEDFVKSGAVSREIGGVASNYTRAFARGDFDYYLTVDEILVIVENLELELSGLFDHQMTSTDNIRVARVIDDIMGFSGLTVGDIIYDFGIDTTILNWLIPPYLLWVVGLLCFATLFLLFWQRRGSRREVAKSFLFAGIPIVLSGIIFLTAGVILNSFTQLLGERVQNLARFTSGVVYLVLLYGTVVTVIGVVFAGVYLILRDSRILHRLSSLLGVRERG